MKRQSLVLNIMRWKFFVIFIVFILNLVFSIPFKARSTDLDQSKIWPIDFGSSITKTADCWNNVTENIGSVAGAQLTNLVNAANMVTPIDLEFLNRFTGANVDGTSNSERFSPYATMDSLYGHSGNWLGLSDVRPGFKLTGLDPTRSYHLTSYASRLGVNGFGDGPFTLKTTAIDGQVIEDVFPSFPAGGVIPTSNHFQ